MKAADGGLAIGALLAGGRYEVRACTLEGPAYVDYRVRDREVEVELALWRMDPLLFRDEEQWGAFERAALEMRSVVHQNVRRVFEVGRAEDGVPYVTLPLGSPDGITLRLGSGRTASELDVMRYATAMAEGLEAVHAAGYVHGRLTPPDLVEMAGLIKVSGAGLYRGLARDPTLAAERWGEARRYLAPEVIAVGAGDRRSDVYSMAAILCELASGVSRPDLSEATEQLASEQLGLADLLARALSVSPERRPARPAELVDRMRRLFIDERVPTLKRPVLIRPEARGTAKRPALDAGDEESRTLEETSPLFLHPSAAPQSPLFGPNRPTLTHDMLPPGPPPPPAPPPPGQLVVPLRSRREPDGPIGPVTPIMPAIDRPDMQPILRPLSSLRPAEAAPASLGHYAPPRSSAREQPRPRRRLFLVLGLSVPAAALAGVGLALALWGGRTAEPERPPPVDKPVAAVPPGPAIPPPPPAPPPPPEGPCPEGMTLVAGPHLRAGRAPFCVDRHESPGAGQRPHLGSAPAEAAAVCQARGARLCSAHEWEDACRGADGASFPYGRKYVDKKCNARGGEIAAAGSFPECLSAVGAFDMSGNAAEWDAAGGVRGASATDGTRGRCSELRFRGRPRERERDRADIGFRCCAVPLAKVAPTR